MKFGEAISSVLTQYGSIRGRAPRSEYWYFYLFNFILGFVFGLLDGILLRDLSAHLGFGPLGTLSALVLLIPGITVGVRRLHDVDKSGWWLLIAFTIIGIIPLFYWYCIAGTAGPNRFGEDPLGNKA